MGPRDFQQYGPIKRRGRDTRPQHNMAAPTPPEPGYSGSTIPIRTVARRPPPRRSRTSWWMVPIVLLIVLLATALGGMTYLDQRYAGRIYPGVSVQGVDLTEMTVAEAQQALHQRFDRFLQAPLRFQFPETGQSWEPRPEDIGLQVDLRQHAVAALRVGRGNGLVRDLQQMARIWQQGVDLPLHIGVDAGKLRTYLIQSAGELEQPPVEASLRIDVTTGTFQTSESADGRMLLLDETLEEALAAFETLMPQVIQVRSQTLSPALASKDIAEARRTVQAMLQSPMELLFTQQSQTFPISTTDIADMIVVRRIEEGNRPVLHAQLDQKKLEKLITRLADKIGRESIEPRVAWNGGHLQIVKEGRTAYRLDIDRAMTRFNESIMAANRTLDLPVDEVQPQATPENLASLGIGELIASGKSDFTGSAPYRVTNIKAGVNLMNGILVAPDGEFSFNENVGSIDAEHGFVEGYAIVGNRTQKEPGGGICQVSTTLYRAAFYAGLPFTAWTPHRFRISWYEKYDTIGMDSTIFTGGGPDLRFVNDTNHWILIEGIVNDADASVTFNIYGTKVPGRTVERSEPIFSNETPPPTEAVYIDDPEVPVGEFKQTDTARGGLDIEIVRIVKQDNQELRRTSFITRFQAWPNIFLKNPNTPLPPGGRLGNG